MPKSKTTSAVVVKKQADSHCLLITARDYICVMAVKNIFSYMLHIRNRIDSHWLVATANATWIS